jgi:hypothetical protein
VLRQLARQIMTQGQPPDHTLEDVAASAVHIYTKLLSSVSAILGETGSTALFRRSLRLTEATFPFFSAARSGNVNTVLSAVSTCLHATDAKMAHQASVELLAIHLELLTTFIGQRLTEQLVRETWPGLSIPTTEERHG